MTDKKRIVVINDDTAFLDLMHDLLESEGYDVTTHREYKGVHERVKSDLPDLIMLDIVMSGEEKGWEILELLTLDPVTRPVPIIVCTAAIRSLRDREEQLNRLGIRGLPKPFDLDDLLGLVRDALRLRG
jgi:two-component system response regulator RpaA